MNPTIYLLIGLLAAYGWGYWLGGHWYRVGKRKLLDRMARRIIRWRRVRAECGWGRLVPPHDHLFVDDELAADHKDVNELL